MRDGLGGKGKGSDTACARLDGVQRTCYVSCSALGSCTRTAVHDSAYTSIRVTMLSERDRHSSDQRCLQVHRVCITSWSADVLCVVWSVIRAVGASRFMRTTLPHPTQDFAWLGGHLRERWGSQR